MEFPFGRHHRREEEEEEERGYQPPRHQGHEPNYMRDEREEYPRPPPSFHQYQAPPDSRREDYPQPPPSFQQYQAPPDSRREEYPQPPPSFQQYQAPPDYRREETFGGGFEYPQGPPHQSHGSNFNRPPDEGFQGYSQESGFQRPAPPPSHSSVQHVSHEVHEERRKHHNPFSIFHHSSHGSSGEGNRATVRVFCQAEENYSLTIREGKVMLSRADPRDEYQHWIKDERYSTKVKDEEGFPSFALVNKATGQALKHSIGATHPVQLCSYNPDVLDESILWTESKEVGAGFRAVRMVNNIRLNLDALNGDKNHGGVHEGTIAVLWEWKKGENQRWKIVPY